MCLNYHPDNIYKYDKALKKMSPDPDYIED